MKDIRYVGRDGYVNSMMHWKYIKRARVNGKWRYWYDDSANKLSTLQKEQSALQTSYDKNFEKFYNDRKNEDYKSAKNRREVQNVKRWYSSPNIKEHTKNAYGMVGGEGYGAKRELDRVSRSVDSHSKTTAGKVDAYMQKNGAKTAASLNKASDKISKAKSWVNNLVKKKKSK